MGPDQVLEDGAKRGQQAEEEQDGGEMGHGFFLHSQAGWNDEAAKRVPPRT